MTNSKRTFVDQPTKAPGNRLTKEKIILSALAMAMESEAFAKKVWVDHAKSRATKQEGEGDQ